MEHGPGLKMEYFLLTTMGFFHCYVSFSRGYSKKTSKKTRTLNDLSGQELVFHRDVLFRFEHVNESIPAPVRRVSLHFPQKMTGLRLADGD